MTPTLTIVIPTIGRPTLKDTLDSIARQALVPGDRVVVALDTHAEPPRPDVAELVARYGKQFQLLKVDSGYHFMGNPQLNAAIRLCRTDYLCALGDDDVYVDGAMARLRPKLRDGKAVLFQFYAPPFLVHDNPRRFVLWAARQLRVANLSGCCIAAPRKALVAVNPEQRIEVDFDWIEAIVAKTTQKPIWMNEVLIIARPEIRDGQPVHQGVSTCLGCGYVGFTEDFTRRLCNECAPTVIQDYLGASA